mgnify:CR=1 FL=1
MLVPGCAVALLLAAAGLPPARAVLWLLLAGACAGIAARAIARLADTYASGPGEPLTGDRGMPPAIQPERLRPTHPRAGGGRARPADWAAALGAALLLISAARQMAPLAVALSPVAVLALVLHPAMDRWPAAAAGTLAVARGMVPLGAWLSVRGGLEGPAWLVAGAVAALTRALDVLTPRPHQPAQPPVAGLLMAVSAALWIAAGWAAGRGWTYFGFLAAAALAAGWGLARAVPYPDRPQRLRLARLAVVSGVLLVLLGTLVDVGAAGAGT